MTNTATPIFDFLADNESCSIQRHELSCPYFGALRRNLNSIIKKLRESGEQEGNEIADQFRALLLGWLTSPVPFDETMLDGVRLLGEPAYVGVRWGQDLQANYEAALQAARELPQRQNPLRTELSSILNDLRTGNRSFRIYCHKRARPHFDSLAVAANSQFGDAAFLHSVKDYRETGLFDDLIKVGPLRSRGWGAAPDALVTAPRFSHLVQLVWSGCGDEPGFGYDPVSPQPRSAQQPATGETPRTETITGPIRWVSHVTKTGEDPNADSAGQPEDEFGSLAGPNQAGEKRRAVLVQIDDEQGILYPPQAKVLSFDPDPSVTDQLGRRIPGNTLFTGMFVIRPLLHDVDMGGLQAEHGHYSRIWKERLIEERGRDAAGLVARLRTEGLHLSYLHPAISHWCEPPTTVIHAPQKRQHFEILIRVLGTDFARTDDPRRANAPWWQYAWNEIRRSRGEAISAGFQEQDIVEEQLLTTLVTMLPEIGRRAADSQGFAIQLGPHQPLQGAALFNKVTFTEGGFLVPQTELKAVRDLNTLEQWRI